MFQSSLEEELYGKFSNYSLHLPMQDFDQIPDLLSTKEIRKVCSHLASVESNPSVIRFVQASNLEPNDPKRDEFRRLIHEKYDGTVL